MLGRIFGKPKEEPNLRQSVDKLSETREMLEKKERVLLKKVDAEREKAREFTRAKNKRAAIQCLKKMKLYEQQIETLSSFQFRLQDQEVMMEGATATMEVVSAMKNSSDVIKNVQRKMNIDDVDKTLDEINEQTEQMKMVQEALTQPTGAAADFDEEALLAELEELEGTELEQQMLQPATASPSASTALPSVPTTAPTTAAAARPTANVGASAGGRKEDYELEKMRMEMAM